MSGNQFLKRCKTVFLEPELLEVARDGEKEQILLGRAAVIKFTALQGEPISHPMFHHMRVPSPSASQPLARHASL